jgi:hypothetical protein
MVLRMMGAALIARLMQAEDGGLDTAWLMFGPTDPDLVEPPEALFDEPWLLAAE